MNPKVYMSHPRESWCCANTAVHTEHTPSSPGCGFQRHIDGQGLQGEWDIHLPMPERRCCSFPATRGSSVRGSIPTAPSPAPPPPSIALNLRCLEQGEEPGRGSSSPSLQCRVLEGLVVIVGADFCTLLPLSP